MRELKNLLLSPIGIAIMAFLSGAFYNPFLGSCLGLRGPSVNDCSGLLLYLLLSPFTAYMLLLLISLGSRNSTMILGGALLLIGNDIVTRQIGFKTLFQPFILPLTLLPLGLTLGWLCSKIFTRHRDAATQKTTERHDAPNQQTDGTTPPLNEIPPATVQDSIIQTYAETNIALQNGSRSRLSMWITPWRVMFALGMTAALLAAIIGKPKSVLNLTISLFFTSLPVLLWGYITLNKRTNTFIIMSGLPLFAVYLHMVLSIHYNVLIKHKYVSPDKLFMAVVLTILGLPLSLILGAASDGISRFVNNIPLCVWRSIKRDLLLAAGGVALLTATSLLIFHR